MRKHTKSAAESIAQNDPPCLAAALDYVGASLSIIPIRGDGSKAPDVRSWKEYQQRRPTELHIRSWYRGQWASRGVAIVTGAISANLTIIDIEFADIYEEYAALVETEVPGLLARLPVVKTPGKHESGGRHIYFRGPLALPGTKLASTTTADALVRTGDPGKRTLIETRGEGNYVLAPGCPPACHESGRLYEHIVGPPIKAVPLLAADEVETLIRCGKALNRAEAKPASGDRPDRPKGEGLTPGDDYDQRGPSFGQILEPHGWKACGAKGGVEYWTRPGKDRGVSASTGAVCGPGGEPLLHVFTSNAEPFEEGKNYGRFRTYALLNNGGSWSDAAKDLARQGYGERPNPPPSQEQARAEAETASPFGWKEHTAKAAAAPAKYRIIPISECKRVEEAKRWLWKGILAFGWLTGISAKAKCGKTTLFSHLYQAIQNRTPFCGLDVRSAPMLLVTEEPEDMWTDRRDELGLSDNVTVMPQPFLTRATTREWEGFISVIEEWVKSKGECGVILDTITHMWPVRNENDNSEVGAAVLPLRRLNRHGAAVGAVHHIGKGDNGPRGGSEWDGIFDILVELKLPDNPKEQERRRVLTGKGRSRSIPPKLTIQMAEDFSGYEVIKSESYTPPPTTVELLEKLLRTVAPPGITAKDIETSWQWQPKPKEQHLANLLAEDPRGRWVKTGKGGRWTPFRYHGPADASSYCGSPLEGEDSRKKPEGRKIIGSDGEDYTRSYFDEDEPAA
jgi:hypothetical protein